MLKKKDKNKVHEPKNTIVGGVKDSIDINIDKLLARCTTLETIYKFDFTDKDNLSKIDAVLNDDVAITKLTTIKKMLLCLRLGTDEFYKLLDNEGEIADDNIELANTIYDGFELMLNSYFDNTLNNTKLHKNIIDFVEVLYNRGIIYITKKGDADFELYIQKSYIPKDTTIVKDADYKDENFNKYNKDTIIKVITELNVQNNNKELFIVYRNGDKKILNIEKIKGKLIIDFVKTIKDNEKVFTQYKDWISDEIMKYYVIYFIKIFINNYNQKDIQKKTLVTLLKNLRLATIGNYRELKEFRDIINSVVNNETDGQLKNISSEINDKWAVAVSTNRVSHKCDESDNIAGLQNIMFFSFMFKSELNIDINILSKLKHITKTWHRNRGVFYADIKTENCDNIIDGIKDEKTFYKKGFETYIKDLEYKIEKQKKETIPTKIEIYNSFLKTINNLKTNIPDEINSIKESCSKFLESYKEHDKTAFKSIDDLKKHKINTLQSYNDIFP
jgi:hypothetical protein